MIIKEYISDNQMRYREELKEDLSRLRFLLGTESNVFSIDIVVQFNQKVLTHILNDVTLNLNNSAEDVIIELESMDLYNFIGALDW